MHRLLSRLTPLLIVLLTLASAPARADHHEADTAAEAPALWVTYPGGEGPGQGKHIVLVSGDDEYRSEEALPLLGQILSQRYGFECTVLFAVDPATGLIVPSHQTNIPGLESLEDADLMIIATRFRNLPDEQMAHIDAYVQSGRPIVGMRTATHAFNIPGESTYSHYSWRSNAEGWEGGFGRVVLGETWIAHHGHHAREATRGIIAPGAEESPIVRGIEPGSIWGDTDVYRVRLPLPGDSTPIVLGAVLVDMTHDGAVIDGPKNDPMMPVAWTKTYTMGDNTGRVFTTTMGAATDLAAEGTRRMIVQGAFWALGMEDAIPADGLNVDLPGEYNPTNFGFNRFREGMRPSDYALPAE